MKSGLEMFHQKLLMEIMSGKSIAKERHWIQTRRHKCIKHMLSAALKHAQHQNPEVIDLYLKQVETPSRSKDVQRQKVI